MSARTIVGVVLIVLGALALAYPTLTYTDRDTVIDAGPIEVTTEDTEQVTIPDAVGGVAVATGIGLLLLRRKPGHAR